MRASLDDVEGGEAKHSMPHYSEIIVEGQTQKNGYRKRPAFVIMILATILLFAVVTALGVFFGGKVSHNKSSSSAAALTSTEYAQSESLSPTNTTSPATYETSGGSIFIGEPENPHLKPSASPTFQPVPHDALDTEEEAEKEEEEEEEEETVAEENDTSPPTTPEVVQVTQAPETDPPSQVSQPTANVPTMRFRLILEFLVNRGVASKTDLETEGTYAHQALDWIANQDFLVLPLTMANVSSSISVSKTATSAAGEDEIFITRYVLAHAYFALGGPKWTNQANFLSGKPTCDWTELVDSIPRGVGCSPEDGRVRSLVLYNNKLENQLPSELGLLTDLIILDLDDNFIVGSMPDTFQALTALEHLHMASAGLSGTLPSWIGQFSHLGSLNLGDNILHGTVPSQITKLSALRELALDHNAFEGDINALFGSGGFEFLEELFLESNTFSGELGDDFGADMNNLIQLDLSNNSLAGKLPKNLFSFPKLDVLDIHTNAFTSLPEQMEKNEVLKFFAAHKNALTGNIDVIDNLSALTHLDLSQNQLNGTMPATLGERVVDLNFLSLAENPFEPGPIPLSLFNLFSLEGLSLKSTARGGTIPDTLGMMDQLVFLDLDNNALQGAIPTTLGALTNLRALFLNRNKLMNDIPSSFERLSNLQTLFLEGNYFSGGLNHICGIIPPALETEIIAQCSLCDAFPGCCSLCCEESFACNPVKHVSDMDPMWQPSYERHDFPLDPEDLWG